ncbi:MAG: glycosyltransferase family 2 protein [Pseudonocardiaceae bacterium]
MTPHSDDSATVHFVIPFYGADYYLFATIASAQRLSRADWTMTVIDDCNPDTKAADHIGQLNDPRIRYLRNECNLGVAGNLYRALQLGAESTAHYVTSLGADDLLLPNYIDVIDRAFRDHPSAIIVQPGVAVIGADDEPITPLADRVKRVASWAARRRGEIGGEDAVASLLRGNWTYLPSLAFRREVIERTRGRGDIDAISDLSHAIDMLLVGGTIALPTEIAFHYRRHAKNDSSTRARTGRRFEEERRYYQEISAELTRQGWTRAARAADRHLLSRLHEIVARYGRNGS